MYKYFRLNFIYIRVLQYDLRIQAKQNISLSKVLKFNIFDL